MKTIVARVVRVRMGHSPTAMVQAVDQLGHDHRLEIPVEDARDISPGGVLVLHWSVHGIPDMPRDAGVEIEVVPTVAAPVETASAPAPVDEVGQLEAMLGFLPGRLRGVR